jgi:dienelactone hydrolase
MTLCACIIGVAALFALNDMGSFIPIVAGIAAAILLMNLLLRGLGHLIDHKRKVRTWIKRSCLALLVILNVIVSACGFLYSIQDVMIFRNADDPESRELLQGKPGYHEVAFTAENGKQYHGMMYQPDDKKRPLVIYFGGNGEVSYHRVHMLGEGDRWKYFAGYNYLFVDYEGYGLNDGRANYMNMYEEALAVFDYAASLPNVDDSRIVAMGFSLGTGSAVYLAANRPASGLILTAPYANGYDMYNGMMPVFHGPMKLLVKQKLPSDEYAPNVTCPTLVIASHGDEAIPFSTSEKLSKLFGGDVDFMALDEASHNNISGAEGVYDRIHAFLEEVASK